MARGPRRRQVIRQPDRLEPEPLRRGVRRAPAIPIESLLDLYQDAELHDQAFDLSPFEQSAISHQPSTPLPLGEVARSAGEGGARALPARTPPSPRLSQRER